MAMKENPLVPKNEQETVIQIDRATGVANIYTTDSRVVNKLDKIYERSAVHKNKRRVVAVEYEVSEKLITFRSKIKTRSVSNDERQVLVSKMKRINEQKKN